VGSGVRILLMTFFNLKESVPGSEGNLHSAVFLLGIEHPPHNYSLVAAKLGLASLAEHRSMFCVKFLNGLLSGHVDSFDLLSLINFKVSPHQICSNVPFYITMCCDMIEQL